MLATLMIAVLIGLIPATIASNKGGPFASWWMFGTALFIIALPACSPDEGRYRRCGTEATVGGHAEVS